MPSECSRTWRGSAGTTGAAAMTDAPRLVVNADDFGLSTGVNRGILEAHAAGVVSSVSVLVNTPGWTDALRRLRDLGPAPGLGVGLHLNLTMGRPVSWGASLADARTGRFHTLRDRKSTRLNSSHRTISYAVFCLKKKKKIQYTDLSLKPYHTLRTSIP